ncbi:MAG: glycosyltransferase family 39 protein, partial [Candidatus Poribacteria bacterium]
MLNIIFLFFLALISFGIGNKILRLFKVYLDNSLERFVFSFGIGLGVVSYLTFLLAVLGLLYKWLCLLLLFLLLVISLWGIWKNKGIFSQYKRKIPRSFKLEKAYIFEYCLLIILSLYILLCFLSALAPPIDWDSLVYHLPIPKIWIQNHKAIYIPYIVHSARHLAIQTIYALGMVILENDTIPCMIIWMSSLWLILCVYTFCRRYLSPKAGILAMSALYCTPFITAITCKPLVDVPYICYAFLAFYAFYKYVQSNNYKLLLLSGVLSGFSAASKQFGMISFVALFLLLILVELKRKSFIKKLKYIFLFGFLFVLIIAPWIVRCYIYTGEFFNSSHGGTLLLVGQEEKTKLKVYSAWSKIG